MILKSENNADSIINNLHLETAKIPWKDLQRFFAGGKVLLVDAKLDLLRVAAAMVQDDSDVVSDWIKQGVIKYPDDALAKEWFETDRLLWAVVLNPWVLVQEISVQQ